MNLRKRYSFLYIPDDDGRTREMRVPRLVIAGTILAVFVLLVAGGLYVVDWVQGVAWRPGGSPVVLQNLELRNEVGRFESRITAMQADLDDVFAYQQRLAEAIDVRPLDTEARAAGIGGREPLAVTSELATVRSLPDLEQLLHQSRIQRAGMAALLDTLATRAEMRDRIPSIRPCDVGWLSSRFGKRKDPFTGKQAFHRGLDFSIPAGTPVRTTADGVVKTVEKQRGLGRLVKIDHGDGLLTVYGHLQRAKVKTGQHVSRGDVIALSGNSGRSTAPHLHYEVRVAGRVVNPLTYILDTYAERH